MRRIALVLGVVASMAIGQVAQAGTMSFLDNTIHWDGYTSTFTSDESINYPAYSGGNVVVTDGAIASVNFIDVPADHSPGSTFNQWLSAGDLFIDLKADSTWDYVVRSYGKSYMASSVELYDISALNITTSFSDASNYIMGYVRLGQPIALQSSVLTITGVKDLGAVNYSGYFDSAIDSYSVSFDFGSLALDIDNNSFIVGFSQTCGNDVILEKVPVPEPGTMMLLGFGMLGMAVYGKRRMNKKEA